ncbi:MAG: nucleotidyl transferase AbiEii/AbiGii toxin family protein [Deltaproteobacteria bacterium]|nr:nucleotidyl transferase AbiEii/AbiGii toxin family protein [Deltaproteobacteria bacterium]
MTTRTYATPGAFKHALEQRLRTATKTGVELARKRQLLVFDRLLARIITVFGDAVVLKGGLVLELRLTRARTTKDIDLRVIGSPGELLAKLQTAGRLNLGDYMNFEVAPHPDHPEIENDGMQYEGQRFRAECRLAGKIYGRPFGVDVVLGEPMFGEIEVATAHDELAFAGIESPRVQIYPIETHIAEKLHAFTMPRSRPNSRVKDLPDIALLATARALDAKRLRTAIVQTFDHRKTHPVPDRLPEPSSAWSAPYASMAREDLLPWPALGAVTSAARDFLDPVLAGDLNATWDPALWRWRPIE